MNRLVRGLIALLILAMLLIGAPLALLAWVGNPWPAGGWAEVQLITNRTLYGLVAVVGWAAWVQMTACILVEAAATAKAIRERGLAAMVTGDGAARVRFATGGQQQLARVLVTAVAALGIGASSITTSTIPANPAASATSPPTTGPAATPGHQQTHSGDPSRQHGQGRLGPQVEIDRPTTLWKLAETHAGDGTRWRELLDLNRGTTLPDGTTLQSGTQTIPAGTTLTLPQDATATLRQAQLAEHPKPGAEKDETYTVEPGDTLWEIADEELDDPTRYPALFEASQATEQPGGDRLTDPDHIEPGWTITIPAAGRAEGPVERPEGPPRNPNRAGGAEGPRPGGGESSGPRGQGVPDQQLPSAGGDTDPGADPGETASPAEADQGVEESSLDAPWLLAGLTGGGVLLAGALLLRLQERRRRQFRARRPGRAIATPDPELAPVEKTIRAAGGPVAATIEWLDQALRRLAARGHENGAPMPPVAAVELAGDTITLHLSGEADLPVPWQGTPDRLHWHCTTDAAADDLGPDTGWVEAPYPLLVTLGETDAGARWLLNCEEAGSLTITGDPARSRDLARHLAAQLAVNPWSRSVSVDCVGIAEETLQFGDNIRYHAAGPAGGAAAADALAAAVATVDRSARHGTDTITGRTGRVDEDLWPARMLLVDASHAPAQLDDLLTLVTDHVGRTGTSVVLTGDHEAAAGMMVHVTAGGRARLEQQGLDLVAVGLSGEEAYGCGLLYAQRANLGDTEMPVDEAAEGRAAHGDRTGALRAEHTHPRGTTEDEAGEPLSSLLELDDAEYTRTAPVTPEDLDELAPLVPDRVRAQVEADDPTLDADLDEWFDPDSRRPKLAVLGPVKVTTSGKPLAEAKGYCTELVAFLATEDHRRFGVTRDQIAEAFAIGNPVRVRNYITLVRGWLGTNPVTGQPHLPHADKSPAAKSRSGYVYQLDDALLCDMCLFRRLRERGMARGGDEGHRDLVRALTLVTGRPFDEQRAGGYSWLVHTNLEHHLTEMIADTALTVTTRCVAEKDLGHARAAADIAVLAAQYEETTHLALACVNAAEGNQDEAARILREKVYDRVDGDGPPEDLSERTRTILRNQQWLAS